MRVCDSCNTIIASPYDVDGLELCEKCYNEYVEERMKLIDKYSVARNNQLAAKERRAAEDD
jgi:DNA-directed RNA polymerase subunit M/transcription elongation factor TFIIS